VKRSRQIINKEYETVPIVKRGKETWQVRIFLGRDINGKTRFFNQTVKGKRKDAERLETKKKSEIDTGIFVEHSKITVDEYLNKWFEVAARPRLRARTFEDYVDYMKRYVRPMVGRKRLESLKPLDLQLLYTTMLENGLSGRTVRYAHAVLSSALKQAVKWQLIHTNPASMVDLPKIQRKEMRVLSVAECAAFLNAAKNDEYSAIFSLAISTGLRPEEYLGLQWKDVDFSGGTVTVQRALVWKRKGGGWSLEEPKTSKSRRSIPISQTIVSELTAHRKVQLERRLKLGEAYQNHNFVFATGTGSPILTSNLTRRHFKPILEKAGLPSSIRLYDLRHTCATLLLLAKTSPKVVAERLGHSTVVLTLDTYSHVLPSMQQDASEELEKMLFATGN
jgi:integrase